MLTSRILHLLCAGGLFAGVSLLTGCKTIATSSMAYPDTPVSYQMVSEVIDEETIEHRVRFRNVGQDVVSFDYTLCDTPGVPHIDCLGPNSGLVENLYPGAQVEVKNPVKKNKGTYVILGRVTHGKRNSQELAKMYKPSTLKPETPAAGAGGPLPMLEPVNAPRE